MAHEYEGNMVKEFEAFPERDLYLEYEYLKQIIRETAKTPEEYERRVRNLADELGL